VSTVPVKTAEEVAATCAGRSLKVPVLGYLTDKDSSLFLSKEGELFIVKSGETVLKNYQIKAVGRTMWSCKTRSPRWRSGLN